MEGAHPLIPVVQSGRGGVPLSVFQLSCIIGHGEHGAHGISLESIVHCYTASGCLEYDGLSQGFSVQLLLSPARLIQHTVYRRLYAMNVR